MTEEERRAQKEQNTVQKQSSRSDMTEEERRAVNSERQAKIQPRCWEAIAQARSLQRDSRRTGSQRLLEAASKIFHDLMDQNNAVAFYEVAILTIGNENTPSGMTKTRKMASS
jgi:hypothetical protein